MLTKDGEGARGVKPKGDEGWRGVGGVVWKPPKLADLICEQPLTHQQICQKSGVWSPWLWTSSRRRLHVPAQPNPPEVVHCCQISTQLISYIYISFYPLCMHLFNLFNLFISLNQTCPISWPKRKTLPWTSFFRAKAAARWLSYSTNMYLAKK